MNNKYNELKEHFSYVSEDIQKEYRELLEQTERIEKLLDRVIKSFNDYLENRGIPVESNKDK